MIILYIPFERSNCGDLKTGAQTWKNNYSLYTSEKINIIYYQDDFDYEEIELSSKLYILAHGTHNNTHMLLNCADTNKATIIDIDTLVARFEFDFLGIIHHILEIHLYCCGEQQKNWLLAKQFQRSLLRADHANVHFYQGRLHAPDEQGRLLTEQDQKTISATPFNLPSIAGKEINFLTSHIPIKELTMQSNDNFLDKSMQRASDKRKQMRYEVFYTLRSQQNKPNNIGTIAKHDINLSSKRQMFFHPNQPTITSKVDKVPCLKSK